MTTFHNFGPVNKFASAEWLNELRRQESEDENYQRPAPCLSILAALSHAELDAAAAALWPLGGSKTQTHATAADEDTEAQRSVGEGIAAPVLTYSKDWLMRLQAPRMPTDSTKENT